MKRKAFVLLIEDHPLMRQGIKSLINDNSDFEVVAELASAAEVHEASVESLASDVDLVLLDISLPDGSGLDLIPELGQKFPEARIVVLTMHNENPYLARAINLEAAGYVVKDMAPEKLLFTMTSVMAGQQCFLKSDVPSTSIQIPVQPSPPSQELSAREQKVMAMLVDGMTLTEIANELDLSVKTIFTYRVRLLKKLGLKNNAELIKAQLTQRLGL